MNPGDTGATEGLPDLAVLLKVLGEPGGIDKVLALEYIVSALNLSVTGLELGSSTES